MNNNRLDDKKYLEWAKQVKENASWVCELCQARGVYLESHHLNSWDWAVEERYNLENGVCICKTHHDSFHEKYGFGNNTKFQFKEYCQIYLLLKKIAEQNSEKI